MKHNNNCLCVAVFSK